MSAYTEFLIEYGVHSDAVMWKWKWFQFAIWIKVVSVDVEYDAVQ